MASEAELISALASVFSQSVHPGIEVGIGDDGAVLVAPTAKQIAVADMAVEGVHFRREWSSLAHIGAKITAANLADIFAMGAEPTYLLITAGLPEGFTIDEMLELARGIQQEADLVGARVVGGDLSVSEKMVLSITALGESANPILRSGAHVGDFIFLSGLPGWSAAGLACLTSGISHPKAISLHLKPDVDYLTARALTKGAVTSLCDISDGLISEARHLADSSGVRMRIDPNLLMEHPDFDSLSEIAGDVQVEVWNWITGGGEDHVFLGTTSDPASLPQCAWVIGQVVVGAGIELVDKPEFEKVGYSHFQNRS